MIPKRTTGHIQILPSLLQFIILLLVFCSAPQTFSIQEPSSSELTADQTASREIKRNSLASLPLECCFLPYFGTHYYDVFLRDILIGRATIEVQEIDGTFQIRVNAKTRTVFNSLYNVRFKGEVSFLTDPLTPLNAKIEEQTGNKSKQYEMNFAEPDKVNITQVEQKGSQAPKVKEQDFESENFVLDPFSTVYLIRSIAWNEGLTEIFDVVTGSKQYELRLTCTGSLPVEINGDTREAWVIQPETRNLAKPKKSRTTSWQIYLSRDDMREILKISGHPKIGRVEARMRKFEKIF